MKLLINGELIDPKDYSGARGTQITISSNEERGLNSAVVQQEYTVRGRAYEIVYNELINDPQGKIKSIPVKIYEDECCDEDVLLFEGIIRGDTVEWCFGDCEARVNFIEFTEEIEKLNCLKSTMVYDNHSGFQQQIHPKFVYCVEIRPNFTAYAVLVLGVALNNIVLFLTPVLAGLALVMTIIGNIINVLNEIPGVNISSPNFDSSFTQNWNTLQSLIDIINENIIGCGRRHPSPLVRSYVNNVCSKCGVQFSSTILNNPQSDYHWLCYMSAPVEKGTRNTQVMYIMENKPNLTLDLFLDQLIIAFNGDYRLTGNTLEFERKDFFWNGNPFVSFETLLDAGRIVGKLCLSWRDEETPAFVKLEYQPDAVDATGNEALDRYNDIVEWNQPFNPLQKGFKQVSLPFSPARFRGDGIDTDILGQFAWHPSLGQTINQHDRVMIIEKGISFNPKLLIWDQQSSAFARVRRFNVPGFAVPQNENYNFPMLFNTHNASPNTAYPVNQPNTGLYPRFYSIDNPKLINDQGLEWSFTFRYTCDALQQVKDARYVTLPMGTGRILRSVVNLDEQTITLSGYV